MSEKIKSLAYQRKYLTEFSFRFALKLANSVVCQSNLMAKDLKNFGFNKDGIIINNPLPQNKQFQLKEIKQKSKKGFLFVGSISKKKNVDLLIDSYIQYRSLGGSLPLTIVGDGEYLIALKKRVTQLKVDKIKFTGMLKDQALIAHYAEAKGLVLTSSYEGFPNVVLEAVSFGLPFIAYDGISGVTDIHKYCRGFDLVSEYSASAYSESMLRFERINMDQICLEDCREAFAMEKIVNQYFEVFSKIEV